ncbi:MAG: hypothetical protein ABL921_22445 [Pirellula sp.]
MENLSRLTNLAALSLHDCGVTDAGFSKLGTLTKLKEFSLVKADAGDGPLKAFANSKDITKIRLKACTVTSAGLAQHIGRFENLVAID